MNRLGIMNYANNSGLGTMTQDFMSQFDFDAHLIIPGDDKGTYPELSKAKHQLLSPSWKPSDPLLHSFLDLVDTVVLIESDFNTSIIKTAKIRGKRVVMLPMWEWFNKEKYAGADVYLCISTICRDFIPFDNKVYLPWPLDTNKFVFRERGCPPNLVFVHNAGFGGMHYRKGTLEVLKAFRQVKDKEATLLLRSQRSIETYGKEAVQAVNEDPRIMWETQDFPDNASMYTVGDVFLYPSRFDGQALVAEEAMACGFPVFVTDAPPMNELFPDQRFKVKVASRDALDLYGHPVPLNIVDINDLADKMNWAVETDLRSVGRANRDIIEQEMSWDAWREPYARILEDL